MALIPLDKQKKVKGFFVENESEILIYMGLVGLLTASGLECYATIEATDAIRARKKELGVDRLSFVEIVKTVWKIYAIPTALLIASTGIIVGGTVIGRRKRLASAAALVLSEATLSEYRRKTAELVGPKKEKEIRDAISADQIKMNPPEKSSIIVTGHGNTICYDPASDRYFYSSYNHIMASVNALNDTLNRFETVASLNDWYDELGIPHINPTGEFLGWDREYGPVGIDCGTTLTDTGEPAIAIQYGNNLRAISFYD